MMLGISQEKLGDGLGLTFQQVQKYEKGTNRVGASRLSQIAQILQAEISSFFVGSSHSIGPMTKERAVVDQQQIMIDQLFTTGLGVDLARAFTRLKSNTSKRLAVELIQHMASLQK